VSTREETAPQRGIFGALNRALAILITLAILAIAAVFFIPEIQRHREERAEIERLRSEVQRQELALAEKTRELQLLRSDPAYVEILARDKLDLMKEGETIFRITPSGAAPAEPASP